MAGKSSRGDSTVRTALISAIGLCTVLTALAFSGLIAEVKSPNAAALPFALTSISGSSGDSPPSTIGSDRAPVDGSADYLPRGVEVTVTTVAQAAVAAQAIRTAAVPTRQSYARPSSGDASRGRAPSTAPTTAPTHTPAPPTTSPAQTTTTSTTSARRAPAAPSSGHEDTVDLHDGPSSPTHGHDTEHDTVTTTLRDTQTTPAPGAFTASGGGIWVVVTATSDPDREVVTPALRDGDPSDD